MKTRISYDSIDTSTQKKLDDLVFLASQIFKRTRCFISIFEQGNELLISQKGLELNHSLNENPFSNYLFNSNNQPVFVYNALKDERFNKSSLVTGTPAVRFYAGIPLVSCKGVIYGTFSLMDREPGELNKDELTALKILSHKAMSELNSNRLVLNQNSAVKESYKELSILENTESFFLKKTTHESYYENALFEIAFDGNAKLFFVNFLSSGFIHLYPDIDPNLKVVPPLFILKRLSKLDRFSFTKAFLTSMQSEKELKFEYLKKFKNGDSAWYRIIFSSEKKPNDKWLIHGMVKNITYEKEYKAALKKILFDISHIIRKPITTIIGLSDLLNTVEDISLNERIELVNLISLAAKDLEKHTLDLNSYYQNKMDNLDIP
ncbi:GAF domain-containing protein [Leeuwenhoekiella aestuarii]|uniref:GAF domain-containing protein n=1 Tax=Leeuwenhoekiella aestuarii TaxID=2249426 RepID=A0A4Q0NWV6_9FLAO|nr:GAF domain-containing protein [Leeuwenhoekiella aestuarii]RXG16002.1 GAF domain-containing protein [Leeuwenhoekiella aestuarii]RXG16696.1 GAF domain-containing protein [Leeuwenhoekiella aestuarii]